MSAKKIRRIAKREAQKIMLSGQQNTEELVEDCPAVIPSLESLFDSEPKENETSSDSEEDECNICQLLGKWASDFSISFVALNALLCLLIKCGIKVPKDGRTILKTPTTVVQRKVGDGIYVHYGIKNALTDFLQVNDHNLPSITLDFGIDGLPLFKSSSKQVWPILGSIINTSYVFLVGVYEGTSKPYCSNDFLSEFISELNIMKAEGLVFCENFFNILVRCFVMDAPARSFVLGTKGHSGYFCCVRCPDKGQMVKNRLVFPPSNNLTLRSNESFRNRLQPEHHTKQTPSALELLDIDMISQCSLDYMHVVCLGVIRTLLKAWIKKKGEDFSLVSWKINTLSKELVYNAKNIPKEFARKPRSLKELDRWKATELRQFLLYTGPFILKNIISPERYHHFLKLSLALRILLNESDSKKSNLCAQQLLKSFVQDISLLYDESFLTYNFHCLLHIHEDAKLYGSLEGVSAFKFENYMQNIKKKVRKAGNIASQIYKRQVENSYLLEKRIQSVTIGKSVNGNILNVNLNGFIFAIRNPDCFCLVLNNIIKITQIKTNNNVLVFHGRAVKNLAPYFVEPIASNNFNIYWVTDIELDCEIQFSTKDIIKKCICLNCSEENIYFFAPLISNVSEQ